MKAQRTHTVLMTVRFDEPVTKMIAADYIRDCIYGNFYCWPTRIGTPVDRVFTVKAIKRVPAPKREG